MARRVLPVCCLLKKMLNWSSLFQYIALERLESVYKSCNLVANICVHATADAKQPIAIIIPHEVNLRHILESSPRNVDHTLSLADLCAHATVQDLVLKECNAIGRREGFKPAEVLLAVVLTPEEWTPENGLVTPAQKIQRNKIAATFADEIKVSLNALVIIGSSLISSAGSVPWIEVQLCF